jgi:hypothetical protein
MEHAAAPGLDLSARREKRPLLEARHGPADAFVVYLA